MPLDLDVDSFYHEQDKRMRLPDEDFNEYLARIGARTRFVLQNLTQPFVADVLIQASSNDSPWLHPPGF
jgi:hypothetical protein